jgi:hypothetical protein
MSKIKEMYDTIDNWYQTQDSKKIKYLCGERLYDDGKPEVRLQITVDWYLKIKGLDDEGKSLVFGEKLATLKDISQHMLNYLPTDEVLKEEERLAKKELGKDGFE